VPPKSFQGLLFGKNDMSNFGRHPRSKTDLSKADRIMTLVGCLYIAAMLR